jgi:hypothetical protein
LVKHHTYKLHASAAFIALEDIDFECPFEQLKTATVRVADAKSE